MLAFPANQKGLQALMHRLSGDTSNLQCSVDRHGCSYRSAGLTNCAGTVDSIIALAFVMVQRRARSRSDKSAVHVQSIISRRQLQW